MIRANILAFTSDANAHLPPPEKTAFFHFSTANFCIDIKKFSLE